MDFLKFITRLDEELIHKIVGKSAVTILKSLNSDLARISRLQNTLLNIYSPTELLKVKEIRDEFIDILNPNEAAQLCTLLGRKTNTNSLYTTLKGLT